MSDSWPGNVCLQIPSRMSHNLAEASQAPLTNVRESGANDSDITSPVWPEKHVHCWPVSMSHKALFSNKVLSRKTTIINVLPSHVTTGRHNLVIVDESAAGQIAGVAGQLARHAHVTFAGLQRVNTADVVQATASHVVAAWSIRARHDPRATQRDGMHLHTALY